jgi:hypothetical protein
LQGGFEVFGDFAGEDVGIGEIGAVFEGLVFEPEEVEVYLVALEQLFVGEAFPTLALLALGAILGGVAGHEIVEIGALERVFLEREVQVRAEVVNPELRGPGLLVGGGLRSKKRTLAFALRVEDARREAEQRVDVGLLEQHAADRFAGAASEEDVEIPDHDPVI